MSSFRSLVAGKVKVSLFFFIDILRRERRRTRLSLSRTEYFCFICAQVVSDFHSGSVPEIGTDRSRNSASVSVSKHKTGQAVPV